MIISSSPLCGQNRHVKSVTAITEVFGDGQKVSAVAVEYDSAIVNSNLTISTFSVEGRSITKVYANNAAAKAANVKKMIEEGDNIKYTVFERGTVWPLDQAQSGRNEHMQTWQIAFSIEGVRDWLFTQRK